MQTINYHLMFEQEGIEAVKKQLQYHLAELKKARETIKLDNKLRKTYPDMEERDIEILRELEQVKIETHADVVEKLARQITDYKQHYNVEEIKARHNIRDWIRKRVEIKDRGKRAVGLCPFHEEKTPSFTVYEDSFYCFGCHKCGDIITWIMETENLNFKQALTKLL